MNPIFLVGAGIVLLGVGLGLGYWFAHIQGKRDALEASTIQKELDDYRREVSDHFNETAQHFQALGQQYQTLYEHMAHGAGSLCDQSHADTMLRLAAGSAIAATGEPAEEVESAREVISDYAPVDELETVEAEAAGEVEESTEEPVVEEIATEEPPVDEIATEQIVAADPDEAERTVH